MLKAGDHVRRVRQHLRRHVSGCSTRLLRRYQLSFTYVDTSNLDEVEKAMTPANADVVRRDAHQPG